LEPPGSAGADARENRGTPGAERRQRRALPGDSRQSQQQTEQADEERFRRVSQEAGAVGPGCEHVNPALYVTRHRPQRGCGSTTGTRAAIDGGRLVRRSRENTNSTGLCISGNNHAFGSQMVCSTQESSAGVSSV
ncbi:MAG: hypothetical protein ACI80N_004305, partial [Gammaproteobacteria bacterium]